MGQLSRYPFHFFPKQSASYLLPNSVIAFYHRFKMLSVALLVLNLAIVEQIAAQAYCKQIYSPLTVGTGFDSSFTYPVLRIGDTCVSSGFPALELNGRNPGCMVNSKITRAIILENEVRLLT
jgi:hypothetical protein